MNKQYLVMWRNEDSPSVKVMNREQLDRWMNAEGDMPSDCRFLREPPSAAFESFPPHSAYIVLIDHVVLPEPAKVVTEWRF